MGGLFGGGQQQSIPSNTTTTTEIAPTLRPFVERTLEEAQTIFEQGPRQQFPDSTVVPFSEQTQLGLQQIERLASAGVPGLEAAREELEATARGDFLSAAESPQVQEAIRATQAPTVEAFREAVAPGLATQFARAGRTGSEAEQAAFGRAEGELADALARTASQIAVPITEAERTRQLSAIGALPGFQQQQAVTAQQMLDVGGLREAEQQALLQEEIDRFRTGQFQDEIILDEFITRVQGLGPLTGGVSTTTGLAGQPSTNRLLTGLGGAASGASLASMLGMTAGPTSGLAALGLAGAAGPIAVGGLLGGLAGLL